MLSEILDIKGHGRSLSTYYAMLVGSLVGWSSPAVEGFWTICDIYEACVVMMVVVIWRSLAVRGLLVLWDNTVTMVMLLKEAFIFFYVSLWKQRLH